MSRPAVFVVVGAGPSGFYAAEALLRAIPDCQVHIVERLAAPQGLVRYGVAPDHQKLKQVAATFDEILSSDRLFLHAGVDVGSDLSLDDLRAHCDAVVLAVGCGRGRLLGVPGESLGQVFSAAAFVGWYNGHPDHTALAPDLAVSSAIVIGHGNVALDVCRLLVREIGDLEASDIPGPMLGEFRRRALREVHVLGRGGPGDVKFSFKEFRQLVDLPNVRLVLPQAALLDDAKAVESKGPDALRVVRWLKENVAAQRLDDAAQVRVHLWFDVVPAEFLGNDRVDAVRVRHGDAGRISIPCGIAISCVGFSCEALSGVPAYTDAGTIANDAGQVLDAAGCELPGLFVAGWAKRGPTGIIGTNRADANETVGSLLQRLPGLLRLSPSTRDLRQLMAGRGLQPLTHIDWRRLDQIERTRGEAAGKPREKFLSADEARAALAR